MKSAHEPGEVTWVEVPGGRLAVDVSSRDSEALNTEALNTEALS